MDLEKTYSLAMKLRRSGQISEAIEQLEFVLRAHPHFEHGFANYDLAGCYEDIGQYVKAEQQYREALSINPDDPMFVGGLASFTFLYGDPKESLDLHLKLLRDESTREIGRRKQLLDIAEKLARKTGVDLQDLGILSDDTK
jgi:tetratricopeptide (TPR) repeat protein